LTFVIPFPRSEEVLSAIFKEKAALKMGSITETALSQKRLAGV
jgi:hypothetical protein